jgi:hypothetical protein
MTAKDETRSVPTMTGGRDSVQQDKVFRYKLDFSYQSALIYLVTLVAYGGIRGSFVEQKFQYVLNDPILYLIVVFVVMSLVMLILNMVRNKRLIVTADAVIFKHRWHEVRVPITAMEWIHIGRETRVQTGGRFQVILLKLLRRRRLVRIRVGRYEREKELVAEMTRLAAHVPRKTKRRWRRPRFTDR